MSGRFLDPLIPMPMEDGLNWIVCLEMRFLRYRDDPSSAIVVPLGFQSDFASTPRAIWPLLPPTGRYIQGALVHDVLYRLNPKAMSRLTADTVLLEIMELKNVPEAQRLAIYDGVRLGGQSAWDENAVRYAAGERWSGYVPVVVTKK
jgi:hypothetical protein